MTIAVSLKVHDGVVLAADSASTLVQQQPNGTTGVINVYDNANKIVNLVKGLPLGVITWGSGSIGPRSITTIFKDLRSRLSGAVSGPNGEDWKVDPTTYTVADVAARVKQYVHEELYVSEFSSWSDPPALGMIVTGYSAGAEHAEEFSIGIDGTGCPTPTLLRPGPTCGFTLGGQSDGVSRLVMGVDPGLATVLEQALGVPATQAGPATDVIKANLSANLVQDAMPFQDALDLAEFFVDLTIRYTRFLPGPATVGGPIEIAGITKHEGFKWVKRKHYYEQALNPGERP